MEINFVFLSIIRKLRKFRFGHLFFCSTSAWIKINISPWQPTIDFELHHVAGYKSTFPHGYMCVWRVELVHAAVNPFCSRNWQCRVVRWEMVPLFIAHWNSIFAPDDERWWKRINPRGEVSKSSFRWFNGLWRRCDDGLDWKEAKQQVDQLSSQPKAEIKKLELLG